MSGSLRWVVYLLCPGRRRLSSPLYECFVEHNAWRAPVDDDADGSTMALPKGGHSKDCAEGVTQIPYPRPVNYCVLSVNAKTDIIDIRLVGLHLGDCCARCSVDKFDHLFLGAFQAPFA